MMMRKRTKRTTVERMSALWSDRERLWRWADWLLALLLAALAQYEIWIQSLAEDGIPRPHAVHALFALLITLPLAWRRGVRRGHIGAAGGTGRGGTGVGAH